MTREEHIEWCKKRAKEEFNFYSRQGIAEALRNGMASMISDIGKLGLKHIQMHMLRLRKRNYSQCH
jgi:hypothetical protein